MFCLTFKEESDEKYFYYHNFDNAVNMQRVMLITEITNVLNVINNNDSYCSAKVSLSCSDYDNSMLQYILLFLIDMSYNIGEEECYKVKKVYIDVTEIKYQD